MTDVDVLVVGAGPTGLTLALELIQQKVSFRIIEKATERSPYSRAFIIQGRTLELMNRYAGNVRELVDANIPAVGLTMIISGKRVADSNFDFASLTPSNFPEPVVISQADMENYLEKLVNSHGVAVETGVEAKSIEHDADGVTARLVALDGTEETIRAKYVVGADGAHSVVRKAAKTFTFKGASNPQEFILADVYIKADLPMNRAYMCLGSGLIMVLPLTADGLVRLAMSRQGQPGTKGAPVLEEFEVFLKEVFPGQIDLYNPGWLSTFSVNHRIVNSYREGRLFLAGDAAHIHSPSRGQGMNTCMQDSINLGWKLGTVIRGEESDSFLDTYSEERRPIGLHLVKISDRSFSPLASNSRIFIFFRNLILPWVLPWIINNRYLSRMYFKTMSQFGVRYRRSSIVSTAPGFKGPIKGGDRAVEGKLEGPEGVRYLQQLCTPDCQHLVLFSGIGSQAVSEGELHRAETRFLDKSRMKTKVHTVFAAADKAKSGYVDVDNALHKEYGFKGAGYAVIRPDSYVGHIGPLSALDDLIKSL